MSKRIKRIRRKRRAALSRGARPQGQKIEDDAVLKDTLRILSMTRLEIAGVASRAGALREVRKKEPVKAREQTNYPKGRESRLSLSNKPEDTSKSDERMRAKKRCKERPKRTAGNGTSRRFVPWCD